MLTVVQSVSEKKTVILKLSWTPGTPGMVRPSTFVTSKVMFAALGCSRTSSDPSPAVVMFTATSATIQNKTTKQILGIMIVENTQITLFVTIT